MLFFSRVSNCARVSLTLSGEGYTEKSPGFCFHEYGTLIEQNVNPKVWADGKTVGRAQNVVPVLIKLSDPHLFSYQKEYPLKLKVKKGLQPIIENLKEQGLLILIVHATLLFWV